MQNIQFPTFASSSAFSKLGRLIAAVFSEFSPLVFLPHTPTQRALGGVRVPGGGAKPPQYNQPIGLSGMLRSQ